MKNPITESQKEKEEFNQDWRGKGWDSAKENLTRHNNNSNNGNNRVLLWQYYIQIKY